jgi:hypothetical protein
MGSSSKTDVGIVQTVQAGQLVQSIGVEKNNASRKDAEDAKSPLDSLWAGSFFHRLSELAQIFFLFLTPV